MRVAIAGGHGKVARRLIHRLCERGDEAIALIRRPEHAGDVADDGGEPVVCDLEAATADEVAAAIASADAVVFAAGSGPGSGAERKETMDYGGAAKLIAAARARGVRRYVMVSSMGADPDLESDDAFGAYQRAKAAPTPPCARAGWTTRSCDRDA